MALPLTTQPGTQDDYQKKVEEEFQDDFYRQLISMQIKFIDGSLASYFLQPVPLQEADMLHPTPLTSTILWQGWRPDLHPARAKGLSRWSSLSTPESRMLLFGPEGLMSRTEDKGRMFNVLAAQECRDKRLVVLHGLDIVLSQRDNDPRGFLNRVELAKRGEQKQGPPTPLGTLVQGVSLLFEAGVKYDLRGDTQSALWAWGLALTKLCPWSSDRSWMTYAQARETGLPQLEHSLLWHIGFAALEVANISKDESFRAILASCSKLSWQAAYALPVSTYGEELRIFDLALQLFQQQPGAFRLNFVPSLMETWALKIKEWREQDPGGWPHEGCGEGHVCGKSIDFF